MGEKTPLIEVENLSKTFGLLPVLRGVSFGVARGETIMLLGQNGSGKSTLLRLLAGLSKPTAGFIRIGGWQLPKEAMAVRRQIGLVSHQPLLYGDLSARENLDFFGKLYGLAKAERDEAIEALLDRVGLAKRADSLARSFSRGMQQRLSIARAIMHQPDILLLDEPFTGLDQAAAERLEDLVMSAQREGRTLIMTTHQLGRAPALASRALILSRGGIAFDGNIATMSAASLGELYAELCGGAAVA
ncbi:MAG: heme ABC exporter ATP-binding protein CcmA [Chloroflexota bacterium]|nr:heme ABC exporter ATP-binding protein CcmA [Chloroflexota bacterium]